ncbi:MAG: PEP-CTERM sorting domain-containing protein [Bryobacteraceae bacterium]
MRFKVFLFLIVSACWLTRGTICAAPIVFGVTFQADGQAGFIDIATGNFDVVGTVGPEINDVAIAPDGTAYAIASQDELVTINTSNAAVTNLMSLPYGMETLDFNPTDGVLFAATQSALYTVDLIAKTTAEVGSYGALTNAQNIRFDSAGNLYTTDTNDPTSVYSVSTSNGQATWEFSVGYGAVSLGYVDGMLYGVGISGIGGADNLVWVNPATQSGTQILSQFPSVDFSEPQQHGYAPEPGALWLCGLGLAALVVRSRKRA